VLAEVLRIFWRHCDRSDKVVDRALAGKYENRQHDSNKPRRNHSFHGESLGANGAVFKGIPNQFQPVGTG